MSNTNQKLLYFNPRTWDLKTFESLSRQAQSAGFTHIIISELSERTDFQGADKDSPWTEWSALLPALFKHALPPELAEAYPADFIGRQMAFMKAKHAIVAKLGLKAAYMGQEPHWLNDRVYRRHPHWRGSRADNSLRATGMFYSPNTDHPEVRALYRWAMAEIVRQCPLIDFFFFGTNDSGGFFPWEKRLFSGPNGPTGYEGRDMGVRVAEFLDTLRAGAREGGVDATVFINIHGWFTDDEKHLVMRSLTPGIGCANGLAAGPHAAECSLQFAGGSGVWHPGNIFHDLPGPMGAVDAAAAIRTSPTRRFASGGNSRAYFEALKLALDMPPAVHPRARMDALARIATEWYGPEVADEVLGAWQRLEQAGTMAGVTGASLLGGPVMLRWLTRPFVSHQELLNADERAYWTPYLYQSEASHPDKWLDYITCVGYPIVSTWAEASKVCCGIDGIAGTLADAADRLTRAAARAARPEVAERLRQEARQVRAKRCVHLTTRHYLQLGTLIQVREDLGAARTALSQIMRTPYPTTVSPEPTMLPKGDLGDQGLWYLHRAMRWELDNTHELIDLIKESPEPLFFTAPTPSWTGALVLERNLLESLERKVAITLDHWREAEIGWYRATYGG